MATEGRRAATPRALALLSLALAAPQTAHAYCRLTTGELVAGQACAEGGIPLMWQEPCLSYSVGPRERDELPFEQVRETIDSSFATWTEVTCDGEPIGIDAAQSEALAECDVPEHTPGAANVNAIIFVEDWAERGLSSRAFGVTLVWHEAETGEIVGADMQINETMGVLTNCEESCEPGTVDLANVVTHEAGHFLGLGHSQSLTSSMNGEARPGEIRKRYLNDDDVRGLCAIYGDFGPAECEPRDFVPAGGLNTACYVPETGCSVSGAGGDARGAASAAPWLVAVLALCWRGRRRRR